MSKMHALIMDWRFRARRFIASFRSGTVYLDNDHCVCYSSTSDRTYYKWINDAWTCHREDGPAIEHVNGGAQYFINGKELKGLAGKKLYGKDKIAKYAALV